jgi:hypothetical protein
VAQCWIEVGKWSGIQTGGDLTEHLVLLMASDVPLQSTRNLPMPKSKSNHQSALEAIEKVLALLRSVQTLEGTDKDGVEHLLEMAVENLKK